MRFSGKDHLFMALQGALLFGVNYWLFYAAEQHLTSGMAAVIFSTILVVNPVLFMKGFQNAFPIQTAAGERLQKPRAGVEDIFARPARLPGAIVENVMPDEHFPRKTGPGQTSACDVAALDMQYLVHPFSPARKIQGLTNHWPTCTVSCTGGAL
jgi:hypothetical protein